MKKTNNLFLLGVIILVGSFLSSNSVQAVNCICGGATASLSTVAPNNDLCDMGTPSVLSSTVNSSTQLNDWHWSCEDISCETVNCSTDSGRLTAPTSSTATSSSPSGVIDFPTGFGFPDPAGGIQGVIINFFKWLVGIIGFIALISFIISGLQYFLSAGDERSAETAKKNLQHSILGVIAALSGFVIIQAIDAALRGFSIF